VANPFDNIPEKNIKKVLQLVEGHIFNYNANENIIETIRTDSMIGIVLEGMCDIIYTDYKGNTTITESLTENSMFGTDISLINNREYQILTREPTTIVTFDYKILTRRENIDNHYYNQFILNMFDIINNKIKEKNERIQILSNRTIRNKLLEFFSIERKKTHSRNIYLPHNYSDLANYLSVDRAAMTRELSFMKEEGFIETKGKKITILYDEDLKNRNQYY
jgi:CRP-like cAMP-binding protein